MCTGLATDKVCPASAANAIAAAFHTQGYYVMADIVYQLQATDFGLWVPFIYIVSVFGAGIMLAMGQPPKIYIWFLIGPFIFNWALFTTVPVKGVAWNIGGAQQDQSYVWKLAEVGLLNTNIQGGELTGQDTPQAWGGNDLVGSEGEINVSANEQPSANVHVPLLYLNFDSLISGQIQALTAWTGIGNQKDNQTNDSNIPRPASGGSTALSNRNDDSWQILSNSKWQLFEDIKGVQLHDKNMRGSFMQFMASECGEALKKNINKVNYINASKNRGLDLPKTLFGGDQIDTDKLKEILAIEIPIPAPLSKLINTTQLNLGIPSKYGSTVNTSFPVNTGPFEKFLNQAAPEANVYTTIDTHVRCGQFLRIIVQGFRWESGHQYNQLIAKANELGMTEQQVVRSLIYGWSFKKGDGNNAQYNNRLSPEDQIKFIQNYILINLIRNEAAFAHNLPNERWSPSDRAINYVKTFQATLGSTNKFGEFYSWAKLMPYVQGVLLYVLTVAYPFACIFMVIPGMWKTMFTWMAFMAWAKSWDLGFAIVMTLERSVWAMLGNSKEAAGINGRILELKDYGSVSVACPDGNSLLGCANPIVKPDGKHSFEDSANILDQGLLLSGTLGMEYSGSGYYIYIMSALYFAVPAVTGQILLGAKAGASSIASGMFNQAASSLGQAAQSGASSHAVTGIKHATSHTQQAVMGKATRQGASESFMARSLGDGNRALDYGTANAFNNSQRGLVDLNRNVADAQLQQTARALKAGVSSLNAAGINSFASMQNAVTGLGSAVLSTPRTIMSAPASLYRSMVGGSGRARGGSSPQNAVQATQDRASTNPGPSGGGGPANRVGARKLDPIQRGGVGGLLGVVQDWADYNSFTHYGNQNMRIAEAQAALIPQGFELGARQSGYQAMGARHGEAAKHAAQQSAFLEMEDYTSRIAGSGGVLGAFAGSIEAGPPPASMEGLISAGQGSRRLQGQYFYPAQQYQDKVSNATGQLGSMSNVGSFSYWGGINDAAVFATPVLGAMRSSNIPQQVTDIHGRSQASNNSYQPMTGQTTGAVPSLEQAQSQNNQVIPADSTRRRR